MNISLHQAAAAMSANARWQEALSENLAATNIPGYKKQDLTFEALHAGLTAGHPGSPTSVIPHARVTTNFTQGQLRATGVPTDLALEGRGYFEIQLPDGSRAYTRDGEFHLDAAGRLSTKAGHLVLGEAGPIQLDPTLGGTLTISPQGDVSQGEEIRGKIKILDFADPRQLTQMGGGYYTTGSANLLPEPVATPALRQGYLEAANTNSMAEMATLISVMRHFEASQRLMQLHDERLGRTITELGQTN